MRRTPVAVALLLPTLLLGGTASAAGANEPAMVLSARVGVEPVTVSPATVAASLTGRTWTQLAPQESPAARAYAGVAYHRGLGKLVMFGGFDGDDETLTDQTYAWDGASWDLLDLGGAIPEELNAAPLAYDRRHDQLVLHNFNGSRGAYETWTFDEGGWKQQTPEHSPAVTAKAMDFDPALGKMVSFGGYNVDHAQTDQMWAWNGTDWKRLRPEVLPTPRHSAFLGYDRAERELVLFGGDGREGALNDTWTWDGATWTEQSPTRMPADSVNFEVTAQRRHVALFDGETGDTWVWKGDTWRKLRPGPGPGARPGATFGYDRASRETVVFGGIVPDGTGECYDDTWVLRH